MKLSRWPVSRKDKTGSDPSETSKKESMRPQYQLNQSTGEGMQGVSENSAT